MIMNSRPLSAAITAIASCLPQNFEGSAQLQRDNPEWRIEDIESKTGISTRYIADSKQDALDLALLAAKKLIRKFRIDPSGISGLILVTQSPRYVLPTSACLLQDLLGLSTSCMAFDVNLGCSGFVYGLSIAGSLIESGVSKNVLLVCSDAYSKYISTTDRTCRPIFSDGASAVLLEASTEFKIGPFILGTDGRGAEKLIVRSNQIKMEGADVFMFTLREVPKSVNALLDRTGRTLDEVALFVFHQASKIVVDGICKKLRIPESKVIRQYQKIGNTVSASIPMALEEAILEGRLRKNDLAMLVGFGVGYSWGACFIEWPGFSLD